MEITANITSPVHVMGWNPETQLGWITASNGNILLAPIEMHPKLPVSIAVKLQLAEIERLLDAGDEVGIRAVLNSIEEIVDAG